MTQLFSFCFVFCLLLLLLLLFFLQKKILKIPTEHVCRLSFSFSLVEGLISWKCATLKLAPYFYNAKTFYVRT